MLSEVICDALVTVARHEFQLFLDEKLIHNCVNSNSEEFAICMSICVGSIDSHLWSMLFTEIIAFERNYPKLF